MKRPQNPRGPTARENLLDELAPITTMTIGEANSLEWKKRSEMSRRLAEVEDEAIIAWEASLSQR